MAVNKEFFQFNMNPFSDLPEMHIEKWEEVTKDFFANVKHLKLGELVHDDSFGLLEAMSAIEMMDPKMDAGMYCHRVKRPSQPTLSNLKYENISVSEQIGIIDTTWSCIVSWLDGHSLAQTVFTNCYLYDPHLIQDKPLKWFCIAIYKFIDVVRDIVDRGLVFEDEDFQHLIFGYRLSPNISKTKTVLMLKEIEDELNNKCKTPTCDNGNECDDTLLVARLRFIRTVLQAFINLSKKEICQVDVTECSKLLSACSEIVPLLIATTNKACPPAYESDVHGPVMVGFDPLVNQRLLPPTFPRYTYIRSSLESYTRLDELFVRLRQVLKIINCTYFYSAFETMLEISYLKTCIISRSVMQFLFLPKCTRIGDTINCFDAIKDAAKSFISPPILLPKSPLQSNVQAKDYLQLFLGHCVRPFSCLIQLCGHNRARQRDKVTHLLEEFANLQDEAETLDALCNSLSKRMDNFTSPVACFGTWILYHTLKLMILYILSGLELELYSTHEYCYVFWYLSEFLYGWMVSTLSGADNYLLQQEGLNDIKNKRKTKGKNKKKVRPYTKRIIIYQALQNLCAAYYKAVVAMGKDRKISFPQPEFDNEKVRFEHRFAPFLKVLTNPPPVQYSEFKEITTCLEQVNVVDLYVAGCKQFHQARILLESVHNPNQEVIDLLRVAKTNFIVLKLLATGNKVEITPNFDFSIHHHFPIIKI